MATKRNESSAGIFDGTDIAGIDDDFSIVMPGGGDPGKDDGKDKNKDKNDDNKDKGGGEKTKTRIPGLDMGTKIEVPETKEELDLIEKGSVGSKKSDDVDDDEDEKNKRGEEEDAIITEDSPLYLHAATLLEDGILPTLKLEEFLGKKYSEALKIYLDKQKTYIEEGRNEYMNSLSERQKDFLEMIDKGIAQEQVEHQFAIEDAYSKVTDEILSDDTELQEQLITNNFKLKGIGDKQIEVFINASKEKETLFEDSKVALDEINAYIKNQKETMVKKAEEEQTAAEVKEKELQKKVKDTIDGLKEIFPGIEISAKEKTDSYEYMTKPVEVRTVNGQKVPVSFINKKREEDPVAFNLKLIYYIQQGLFDKDVKDTKFTKKITSGAAERLSGKFKGEQGVLGQGTNTSVKDKNKKPEKVIFPKF